MRLSPLGTAVAIGAGAFVATLGPQAPQLWAELSGPSFPDALLALGTLVALGLAGWIALIATLVTVGASSRVIAHLTPDVLRGALLAGAAGAMAVGPAHADQQAVPEARIPHSVTGLPLPDRPEAQSPEAQSPEAQSPDRAAPAPPGIAVRPGDTLWAIAARSLPTDATEAQVAAATRAWHRANRDVIGADPDLIFPTQRLTPPTGKDLP